MRLKKSVKEALLIVPIILLIVFTISIGTWSLPGQSSHSDQPQEVSSSSNN